MLKFWPFKQVHSDGYRKGWVSGFEVGQQTGKRVGYQDGKKDAIANQDTPCILDETDTEYIVVQKNSLQWVIRPVSQIILRNDGPDGDFIEHLVKPGTGEELPFVHHEFGTPSPAPSLTPTQYRRAETATAAETQVLPVIPPNGHHGAFALMNTPKVPYDADKAVSDKLTENAIPRKITDVTA